MSKQKRPANHKRNQGGFNKIFNDKSAADRK
jgi:hypothetical protein